MFSSSLIFAATSSLGMITLVQGQSIHFTALDELYSRGCSTGAPTLYSTAYLVGNCYQGSPSLVKGLYYGSTTCDGAKDGSFKFESINGTVSATTDATIIIRHYSDSACASPLTPFVSTADTLMANKGCVIASLNFLYPIKAEIAQVPQITVNPSPKAISVATCSSTSTTYSTSTSTATSATATSSTVTGTTSTSVPTGYSSTTSASYSSTSTSISSAAYSPLELHLVGSALAILGAAFF